MSCSNVAYAYNFFIMLRKVVILALFLLMMRVEVEAQVRLNEFKVNPALAVRMPLPGDSVNFKGNKFTFDNLLKTTLSMEVKSDVAQLLTADSTGYVLLEKAIDSPQLNLLFTSLRAERFMKATLKLSSSVRCEVYLNGKLQKSSTQTSDSLSGIKPIKIPLRLEPEKDYELVVKLLSTAEDKLAPMVKCEVEPDAGFEKFTLHTAPDLKRRLSLYETAFGSRVRSVSLSPNGKYLLITAVQAYSPKRSVTTRELIEMKNRKVVHANVPESARWMPRSNKLSYTINGESGRDLLTYDPTTNTTSIVGKNIPEGHFSWSPTEDYLIYTMYDEGEKVEGPLKRHHMPDDRIPGARRRSYLVKYTLETGLAERLTYGSRSVYLNDISADGSTLLCSTSKPVITTCPFSQTSIFEINLATLKADTLIKEDAYINNASYSPDGKQLLVLGSPEAFGGIGKNCGSLPIANDFDVQAYLFERASSKVTPISKAFNPTINSANWNRTDGNIYFQVTDEDCERIYRYIVKTASYERLPLEEDVVKNFSLAADAPQVAAYVGGGNYSSGVAYMYDNKKSQSTLLANPMADVYKAIEFGEMSEWNFTAADGTLIKGMICLPPSFDSNRKYPLIVYYYGGTTPTTRGITSPYCAQLFASRGYVVYVIQPSGAIGFGQEFSARHVNAWGDWTADEIIEGTKKFCAAHPFVDAKRIGCIGASYGGFMTQYLQTKTDIFAAAVSHAGISNVTSYWGEGYWGYSYNAIAAAGSYPWNNPDLFVKHGSLFNADKINTPLLLLHGSVDTNVPVGESIQIYNALKILGKPVEFITVDGENHFIADYDKRVLWHNSIMAWFARWLQDAPQWWNDLYPERHW